MKFETNHLFEVMESCTPNILLMLVRFDDVTKNIEALAATDPRVIKVCVKIPTASAIL
jgi:hypothetical protein